MVTDFAYHSGLKGDLPTPLHLPLAPLNPQTCSFTPPLSTPLPHRTHHESRLRTQKLLFSPVDHPSSHPSLLAYFHQLMRGNPLKHLQFKNTTKSSPTPHCPPTTHFSSQLSILKMLSTPLSTYAALSLPHPLLLWTSSPQRHQWLLPLWAPDTPRFSTFGPLPALLLRMPLELLCKIIMVALSLGIFSSASFADLSCSAPHLVLVSSKVLSFSLHTLSLAP